LKPERIMNSGKVQDYRVMMENETAEKERRDNDASY